MSGSVGKGAGAMSSYERLRRWASHTFLEPDYPLVAIEVRPRAVAAVRLAREGSGIVLGAASVVEIPEGVLDVALTRPNVTDPTGFRAVLQAALERAGALSGGAVSLVLPDPAIRITLVSADGVKGHGPEAQETIRFRLHKALPFEVRSARLAWDGGSRGEQVLVAVALNDVVVQYEEALDALGFRPGLVEASTLALSSLWTAEAGTGDRLLVNWDEGYVSFLLMRGHQPLLVRTLPGEVGSESVARQAASTLQFYRERLSGGELDDVVLRAAVESPEESAAALEAALGRRPRLLEPWSALGPVESVLPAQALAGAAASALRRVA